VTLGGKSLDSKITNRGARFEKGEASLRDWADAAACAYDIDSWLWWQQQFAAVQDDLVRFALRQLRSCGRSWNAE
jgi:hypothetical protein